MTGEPHGCPRRHFLALAMTPLAGACQQPREPSMGDRMPEGIPDWMMGRDGMMDLDMMRDMRVIHDLLSRHQDIRRTVQDLSYGIRATTTSARSDVAERIRTHVEQMRSRLDHGAAIRQMDPLFAEIFERAHQVELEIEHVPGGVRVDETSRDPVTAMLIRQHAHQAVSEFVAAGMNRAMRPTPLPPGYTG
ncbi:hypothetical protein GIY23_12555 [Allosaccharopolyspora coralli]|uniref:Uncharacterized protein n=1 Tax=Allosaccharopolyspora coralli TaxID=2665642 RepID=A0A5Q3QHE1_9PSEU|nr:hypothetical protein [Allosaccharopolyspora coralli]QGK70247.1 hypothetical protein GIY23_12555 [Allosaccharopolyspora coralli]